MKPITFRDALKNELKDNEFAVYYEKEKVINSIARTIVEMRQKRGISQAELAKRAKTTQPVIARLEKGSDARVPSLDLLNRVAHAMGQKVSIRFEKE
jgi:predicted transcriptional regulator